ncbi:MAG: hypothetical protein IT426_17375 [Pirellulales bacterium]|nr:hypothetical protein [Pirellulales bacterium]
MNRLIRLIVVVGLISFVPRAAGSATATEAAQFDAAPFAVAERAEEGKVYQLRWNEPRLIRGLEVEFAPEAEPPAKEKIHIHYWQENWNGEPVKPRSDRANPISTPRAERNPCWDGWIRMDDWFNGKWKEADTQVRAEGRRFIFTFSPANQKEFPRSKSGATYRQSLKFQLRGDAPLPPIARVRAWTDAVVAPVALKLDFGAAKIPSMNASAAEECSLEIFNGTIERVRAAENSGVRVLGERRFALPSGGKGSVALDARLALDPHDEQSDRTVVTVRSPTRSFSFAPDEVLQGGKIFIDDLGVLITRSDDPATLENWRSAAHERGLFTVYDRVAQAEEQTLSRAWTDMPLKRKLYFIHGLPGNRNVFRQEPNGDLVISNVKRRFQLWESSPADTRRRLWSGDLRIYCGFPDDSRRGGRELLEGTLPLLRTWWTDGALFYEQETILDALRQGSSVPEDIRLDEPTVLLMRVRILNTSVAERATARLAFATSETRRGETLTLEGERVWGQRGGEPRRFRFLWKTGGKGGIAKNDGRFDWSLELPPGESHEMFFSVPSVTLNDDEIADLAKREFAADSRRIVEYWRSRNPGSAQIRTPEPWLNDFYKTHLRHMEINCLRDREAPRRYATVGSQSYGVYPNESSMMVSDLDRRGLGHLAEQCLQTWLDFQGKAIFPGTYRTAEGVFNSAGGVEAGGYNKGHGYALWCLAEHWKYTRDRKWLERAAPHIIAACDWIIRERQATMTAKPDGSRPIEYGFLPAGSLEDVTDFWFWQATNSATAWGFDAATAALADIGHPEAARLQKEARAYREDVLRGLTEARILTPVVRLRDGTSAPKYPSHLHLRGRAGGWIRETLEGPMFLPAYGLLAPQSPETKWILDDYEDNLYISDHYGYAIPNFDPYWFSRGGFSMQANLLDGPLPYLYRDDVKHYVRAFFNGFASAFDPEVRMLTEHARPELGYPSGDHFKTSDEAQVTYWLRLMFVHEVGEDLYLGQAIPRYWLADGNTVGIENSATYFGPLSLEVASKAKADEIQATFTPPERNPPKTIYLRLRHPQEKPIRTVTLNGKAYEKFDPRKEWIILPGDLKGIQNVIAHY